MSLCPVGFLSRGVSVQGDLCPGGFLSKRPPFMVKNERYASSWNAFLFNIVFFQDGDIFAQLDELDRITHA